MWHGYAMAHCVSVLLGQDSPDTQTSANERGLLCKHVKNKKCIVEIGVFEGFTTKILVENSDQDSIIYGVDPFFKGKLGVSWGSLIARNHNRQHLKSGRLRLVRAFSTEVGTNVPELVDFVFMTLVRCADWAFWSNRVRPEGLIALHDSLVPSYNPSISQLGSHLYYISHIQHDTRFSFVESVDSLVVLRRN